MEEKFASVEEKETEIRQLKTLLRERDRDIERANQMLLTAEESIDVSILRKLVTIWYMRAFQEQTRLLFGF